MFQRLEREHGVKHYLAHNMTVTPANIGQVAEVIRDCRDMGFRMFSFQPAAFIGNTNRWKHDYREFSTDEVWRQVEAGAGARLHWNAFQIGDPRCNRTAYGAYCGERYAPLLDEDDPRDAQALDDFIAAFGGMDFVASAPVLAARLVRGFGRHPRALRGSAGWARRFAGRAGGVRAVLRDHPRAITYVMHAFMDADKVKPAWELLKRGEMSDEPAIRDTQERLQACSYAMAHPGVRRAGTGLRPTLGARPGGEPAPDRGAPADGAPDGPGLGFGLRQPRQRAELLAHHHQVARGQEPPRDGPAGRAAR